MKKIKLTQGKYALVDDKDFDFLNQFKWCAYKSRNNFYAGRGIRRPDGTWRMIGMHRAILGLSDSKIIADHRDGNGLNNQRENLRACTDGENKKNKVRYSNNTSGFKGVYFNKSQSKFQAYISVNGKIKHLGLFTTAIEAAKAYDAAAAIHHGEFARPNTKA